MMGMNIFNAIVSLLTKLVSPVLAFFAGRERAQKNEALHDIEAEKERSEKMSAALRIGDRVDRVPDDSLERLREKLNHRP